MKAKLFCAVTAFAMAIIACKVVALPGIAAATPFRSGYFGRFIAKAR
jgi:hypothetical protein